MPKQLAHVHRAEVIDNLSKLANQLKQLAHVHRAEVRCVLIVTAAALGSNSRMCTEQKLKLVLADRIAIFGSNSRMCTEQKCAACSL